jgi:hypothetical protein
MTEEELEREITAIQEQLSHLQEQIERIEERMQPLQERLGPLLDERHKFTVVRLEAEDAKGILVRRCRGTFHPQNVAYSERTIKREVVEGIQESYDGNGNLITILRTHPFGARNVNFWELPNGREAFRQSSIFCDIDTREYIHPDDLNRVLKDPATPRIPAPQRA